MRVKTQNWMEVKVGLAVMRCERSGPEEWTRWKKNVCFSLCACVRVTVWALQMYYFLILNYFDRV